MKADLQDFLDQHPRLTVLTGAGCSLGSGIPTYRDESGVWRRNQPIQHQDFIRQHSTRQRYWARSLVGWLNVSHAKPNAAHRALNRLEQQGQIIQLITQNVDGLHQKAGSKRVIDLHGRLDQVICLHCPATFSRSALQQKLAQENPALVSYLERASATPGPDGDADIDNLDLSDVAVPACEACGGILKPDVVFFGANVPKSRVEKAMAALQKADALLVVGSSLMVFSGFRFCRQAHAWGKPIAIVNRGITRADNLAALKIDDDCSHILRGVA